MGGTGGPEAKRDFGSCLDQELCACHFTPVTGLPSPRLTCKGTWSQAGEVVFPRIQSSNADLSGNHTSILSPTPFTRFCPSPKMAKAK